MMILYGTRAEEWCVRAAWYSMAGERGPEMHVVDIFVLK